MNLQIPCLLEGEKRCLYYLHREEGSGLQEPSMKLCAQEAEETLQLYQKFAQVISSGNLCVGLKGAVS